MAQQDPAVTLEEVYQTFIDAQHEIGNQPYRAVCYAKRAYWALKNEMWAQARHDMSRAVQRQAPWGPMQKLVEHYILQNEGTHNDRNSIP